MNLIDENIENYLTTSVRKRLKILHIARVTISNLTFMISQKKVITEKTFVSEFNFFFLITCNNKCSLFLHFFFVFRDIMSQYSRH